MQKQMRPFISKPIGGDFGISVELPRLQDVVDYERERIQLTHGYPRFVPHSTVTDKEQLARVSTGMPYALAFPSLKQAHFILDDYILRYYPKRGFFALEVNALLYMNSLHPGRKTSRIVNDTHALILVEVDGITVACLKHKRDFQRLRSLRRAWGSAFDVHRLANADLDVPRDVEATLADTLCNLEGDRAQGALFFQSGMAAISSVALLTVYLNRRFILIGNAYVDTDIIGSSWPKEVKAFQCVRLPEDVTEAALQTELEKGPALIYFELPTNPTLTVVDLPVVAKLAEQHDALVAVDATIITPYNIRLLEHGVDIVLHSTSKFINGGLDHLGGALTTSSKDLLSIITDIQSALDTGMSPNQMGVLRKNIDGFKTRMETINKSTQVIVKRLLASPEVGRVYYPGLASPRQEALAARLFPLGRSGLLSFVLADDRFEIVEKFYNKISDPIKKGPGLGGETSLLCPYVMLAHFHDDKNELKAKGLDFHLIRLSVGVEPVEDIWQALHLKQ